MIFLTFSKPRSLWKIWQKLHKKAKIGNFAIFVIFGVIFGSFRALWILPKKSKNLQNLFDIQSVIKFFY